MALSLFKSKDPATLAKPALSALRAELTLSTDLRSQMDKPNARLRICQEDVHRADALGAQVTAARTALDQAAADARYSDQPMPDQSEAKRQLKELEGQFARLDEIARIARLVTPQLQADAAAVGQKIAALKPKLDWLLCEALVEEAISHRAEYTAAMENMRAAAHKVFAAFEAATAVSRACGFGEYYGSAGLYGELHFPIPVHPAYQNNLTAEAAQAIRHADVNAVQQEAEALITRLLNPET
jgi:chromosome segregation ATPase